VPLSYTFYGIRYFQLPVERCSLSKAAAKVNIIFIFPTASAFFFNSLLNLLKHICRMLMSALVCCPILSQLVDERLAVKAAAKVIITTLLPNFLTLFLSTLLPIIQNSSDKQYDNTTSFIQTFLTTRNLQHNSFTFYAKDATQSAFRFRAISTLIHSISSAFLINSIGLNFLLTCIRPHRQPAFILQ